MFSITVDSKNMENLKRLFPNFKFDGNKMILAEGKDLVEMINTISEMANASQKFEEVFDLRRSNAFHEESFNCGIDYGRNCK